MPSQSTLNAANAEIARLEGLLSTANASLTAANASLATANASLSTRTQERDGFNANWQAEKAGRASDAAQCTKDKAALQTTIDANKAAATKAAEDAASQLRVVNASLGTVQTDRDNLRTKLTAAEASIQTLTAERDLLSTPAPGKPEVDQGAEELAQFIYDRMPGLRVSTFLGGPTLTEPYKSMSNRRQTMNLDLRTSDGTVYKVEVFKAGGGK